MNIIKSVLALAIIFSASPLLANDEADMKSESASCEIVAKSCVKAGFVRGESANKKLWQDCMKPLLMNKTVAGVTVDPATVNTCRTNKIDKMKQELQEFQSISSK